jgi:hypothetical protein
MILLNALFPVLALIVFGWLARRFAITDAAFHRVSDKLVYFVFFPLMLFWKIGSAPLQFEGNWHHLSAIRRGNHACLCGRAKSQLLQRRRGGRRRHADAEHGNRVPKARLVFCGLLYRQQRRLSSRRARLDA